MLISDFWGDVSVVDVFEQVEEELRSDRYKRLARTWLPVVGGVLLLALIAALAWWGYDSWQTRQADEASAAYDRGIEALQGNNPAGAEAAFAEAEKKGNRAYRAMALQHRAALALGENRIPQAIELFDEAAKVGGDPLLADPAALKAAWLAMDNGADLAAIEARLTPLTEEGRPLRAFAQEALALARLQFGKTAEAREVLVLLQLGQDVPDDVRERATAAIAMIDNGTAGNLAAIVRNQASAPAPTAAANPLTAGPAAPPVAQ